MGQDPQGHRLLNEKHVSIHVEEGLPTPGSPSTTRKNLKTTLKEEEQSVLQWKCREGAGEERRNLRNGPQDGGDPDTWVGPLEDSDRPDRLTDSPSLHDWTVRVVPQYLENP